MNPNQNNAPNFKEVGGTSDNPRWEPKAEEKNGYRFDPNGNNCLIGYYKDVRELPRPSHPGQFFTVHEIQTLDANGQLSDCVDISGDTVLNDRLSKIELGTYVKLEYKGRKHKPGIDPNNAWNQTNSYHTWSVGSADNMAKLHEITGGQARAKSVAQPQQQQNNAPAGGQQQQGQQGQGGYQPNQQAGPSFQQTNNAGQGQSQGGYQPNTGQQGGYKPPVQQAQGTGTYVPPTVNNVPPVNSPNPQQQGGYQPNQQAGPGTYTPGNTNPNSGN